MTAARMIMDGSVDNFEITTEGELLRCAVTLVP